MSFLIGVKTFVLLALCLLASLAGDHRASRRLLFGASQPAQSGPAPVSRTKLPTLAIDTALEAKIEEIITSRLHDRTDWGIEVLSLDDDQILYAHNANRPMIPASNMKLFTTATAMHYLGPQYRFKTAVYARPEIAGDGTLHSDLVLRASGDPFFSKNFLTDNAVPYFDEIARQLRSQGVRRIEGNIVGDNSFDTPSSAAAVMASRTADISEADTAGGGENQLGGDGDTESGAASALPLNSALIGVRVNAARSGRPVQVYTEPRTSYFRIINRASGTTGRRNTLRLTRLKGTNTLQVTGRLPVRGKGFYGYIKIEDPASFAAYLLKESMERNGIEVTGLSQSRQGGPAAYREMRELARHQSPPLLEAISITNKQSINPYAELLLRLIGTEVRGRSTPEAGISVVQEYLAQTGIDATNVAIADGSGLSRGNVLSPDAEILLFRYIASQNYYADFVSTLSVAGVDGTLRGRLSGEATAQRIFGKTGTLSNIRTLGGFMVSLQGKRLAFTIFCNNITGGATAARNAIDQIVEVLARHDYESSRATPFGSGANPQR